MAADLLAEDYLLKQITASLMHPQHGIGKKFWQRIYDLAQQQYGTTNIPINTFNKVWIVPAQATVYENSKTATAYVVKSKLKVMLESDYLAYQKTAVVNGQPNESKEQQIAAQVIRQIIIPALEQEVNEGKNFAPLRQIYNSLILATWYKKTIKRSLLARSFTNQRKTQGLQTDQSIEDIYQRYLRSFKKGVYNFIQEENDFRTHQSVTRKYFSGGFSLQVTPKLVISTDRALVSDVTHSMVLVNVDFAMNAGKDERMKEFWQGKQKRVPINDVIGEKIAKKAIFGGFAFDGGYRVGKNYAIGFGRYLKEGENLWIEWIEEDRAKGRKVFFQIRNVNDDVVSSIVWIESGDKWINEEDLEYQNFWKLSLDEISIQQKLGTNAESLSFNRSFDFDGGFKPGQGQGLGFGRSLKEGEEVWMAWVEKNLIHDRKIEFQIRNREGQVIDSVVWVEKGKSWLNQESISLKEFWSRNRREVFIGHKLARNSLGKVIFSGFKFDGVFSTSIATIVGFEMDIQVDHKIWLAWVDDSVINGRKVAFQLRDSQGKILEEVVWSESNSIWLNNYQKTLFDFWQGRRDSVHVKSYKSVFPKNFIFDGGFNPKSSPIGHGKSLKDSETLWMVWLQQNKNIGRKVQFQIRDKNGNIVSVSDWIEKQDKWFNERELNLNQFWRGESKELNIQKELAGNGRRCLFSYAFFFGGGFQPGVNKPIGFGRSLKEGESIWMRWKEKDIAKGRKVYFEIRNQLGEVIENVIWFESTEMKGNARVWKLERTLTREQVVEQMAVDLQSTLNGLLGDMGLGQLDRIELARLLFELDPKFSAYGYQGINLQELVDRGFFEDIEGGGGWNRDVKDLQSSDVEGLFNKLAQMVGDTHELENKLIIFGRDLQLKIWRQRFLVNETQARDELLAKKAVTPEGNLFRKVLEAVIVYDERIKALESRIDHEDLLREGMRLSYVQLENLVKMIDEKKVILADEPGMGKTIEMILFALLADGGNAKEILIATGPLIGKESFERDFKKWLSDKVQSQTDFIKIDSDQDLAARKSILKQSNTSSKRRITVWNYHYFTHADLQVELREAKFDVILFYEAHWLKSEEAKRTQVAMQLSAPWMVLATGTPIDNDVDDIRILLQMVAKEDVREDIDVQAVVPYLQDERKFRELFDKTDLSRLQYLRQLLKKKMVRQIKEEVMSDVLPQKREHELSLNIVKGTMVWDGKEIDLTNGKPGVFDKQRALYEALYQWVRAKDNQDYLLAGLSQLRYVLSDPKSIVESARKSLKESSEQGERESQLALFIVSKAHELDERYGEWWPSIKEAALEHIWMSLSNAGDKFLLFSNYVGSLERYQHLLGTKSRVVVGDVIEEDRNQARQLFQQPNDDVMEVLGTYDVTGQAADFTRAKVVVIESPANRRSQEVQAIGRSYRKSDLEAGHPHQQDGVDVLRLVVDDWLGNPSADRHYNELNSLKEVMAKILENGEFSREIVEQFEVLTKNRTRSFYKGNQEITKAQEIAQKMAQAVRLSRMNDFHGSQEFWDSLSADFSTNLENLAAHTMAVFAYLKLMKIIKVQGNSIPESGALGFVPSGPSVDRRALQHLNRGGAGYQLDDIFTGKHIELDFSRKMLELGNKALPAEEGSLRQVEANMVEEQWPIMDRSLKFLAGSELWTLSDDLLNQQGINPKVWYLSEANRVLAPGGVLMLLSHHLDFSPALIENLSRFGFKVINADDRKLAVNRRELNDDVGDEYVSHVKKMLRHIQGASVVYLVKEHDIVHDPESIRAMNTLDLRFEKQVVHEANGEFVETKDGRFSDINLNEFPWEMLSLDVISTQLNSRGKLVVQETDKDVLDKLLHQWAGVEDVKGQSGLSLDDLKDVLKKRSIRETSDFKLAVRLIDRVIDELTREEQLNPNNEGLPIIKQWYEKIRIIFNANDHDDAAMVHEVGGIDLTSDNFLSYQTDHHADQGIAIDAATLDRWQKSLGIEFNIVDIQTIQNVPEFLGV